MPRKRKDIIALLDQTVAQRAPVLNLSKANLAEMIERVCQMEWLVELDLSHCHLSSLPDAMGNLAGLTRLTLAENQLAALPETIGNLARLERLVLSQNRLTTLPDSITRLTALRHLDLQYQDPDFTVSDAVMQWLKTVPEVTWTDGKPPTFEPPIAPFPVPDHPNGWLARLKSALGLYNAAFAMEERQGNGDDKRREANAIIRRIFSQVIELEILLPEFHQDFLAQRFDSTAASEKTLDANPFRLPTKADDDWMEGNLPPSPLRLEGEVNAGHRLVTVTRPAGEKVGVGSFEHGPVTIGNLPYAPDETYWADCAAWLYQAGPERFYLRFEAHAYSSGTEWRGSDDGGLTWESQPLLTYDWLEKNRGNWRALDHLPLTREREAWMKLHPL